MREGFGALPDGTPVDAFTLTNRVGTQVRILELGAIVQSVRAADRDGRLGEIVLGFDDIDGYLSDRNYIGAVIGRFAGRISGGRYQENGQVWSLSRNLGDTTLHGGETGFDRAVWRGRISDDGARVHLHHLSPDGDQGFPGALSVEVCYELTDANAIILAFSAATSAPTVINLTHHGYWNLAGAGVIRDHRLRVEAEAVLEVDADMSPTGARLPLAGGPLDLREPRRLGDLIDELGGVDHTFVLRGTARLSDPASGRSMEVWTTEPGLTVYTASQFAPGGRHPRFGGVALESEHFPDSPNHPGFPSTALRPGETYASKTIFTLGPRPPSDWTPRQR